MLFRRSIAVGLLAIWLFALAPDLAPALVMPTPPSPTGEPSVFAFWAINYALAAMIFLVQPALAVYLLAVEPVESP